MIDSSLREVVQQTKIAQNNSSLENIVPLKPEIKIWQNRETPPHQNRN